MTYNNCYHITCSPKYRKAVISVAIWNEIKTIIYDVAEARGETIHVIGGDKDHIHILVETEDIAKVKNSIFGRTSRIIRREFPEVIELNKKAFWAKSNHKEICDENHFKNAIKYIN